MKDLNRAVVDLPGNRESEFRAALGAIAGGAPISPVPSPAETVASGSEKKSFVVEIIEALPEQD